MDEQHSQKPDSVEAMLSLNSTSLGSSPLAKSVMNSQAMASWKPQTIRRCWQHVVEQYSRLNLSFETDIFPALSGVARFFQKCQGPSRYFAGLWEQSLLHDLLWHNDCQSDSFVMVDRPEWRAPTWSWASLNCPVKFVDTTGGLKPLCSVVEVSSEAVAGADPMGQLSEGHLVLRGKLIPTILNYPTLDDGKKKSWNVYTLKCAQGRVSNIWADTDTSRSDSSRIENGTEVYCLPVGVKTVSKAFECLLLTKVDNKAGEGQKNYKRIGLFELPRGPNDLSSEWVDSENDQTFTII